MGLFGKTGKSRRRAGGTTIIATGTTLSGDLKPEGSLHIDGKIEGQVVTESDVSIGADGSFEGEIKAHRMVVSGFARGRIECDSLEIVDKGRVLGEVASRAFIIEPGGQFVGESRSTDEEAVAALSHWKHSDASPAIGDVGIDESPGVEPEVPPVTRAETRASVAAEDGDKSEPRVPDQDDAESAGGGWAAQGRRR